MFDTEVLEAPSEGGRARFERASQRAALALQQVVVSAARRCLGARLGGRGGPGEPPSWRELVEIEERAFSTSSFVSQHPPEVLAAFARLSESRLPESQLDDPADWHRDDDDMPAVVLIVRGLYEAAAGHHGHDES